MATNPSELGSIRPSNLITSTARYSGTTLLTLISGGCLTLSFRHQRSWIRVGFVVVGLSLPWLIACVLPSKPKDPDQECSHQSYRERLAFAYLCVGLTSLTLILIGPLLVIFLLMQFGAGPD